MGCSYQKQKVVFECEFLIQTHNEENFTLKLVFYLPYSRLLSIQLDRRRCMVLNRCDGYHNHKWLKEQEQYFASHVRLKTKKTYGHSHHI